MTNIKEQTIPTAYSREVNVESTLKYMGEMITLLAKGTETNGRALHSWKSRYGPARSPHLTSTSGNTSYSSCLRERFVSIRQKKLLMSKLAALHFFLRVSPTRSPV